MIASKINAVNELPMVIDLFSGCGGLGLGFAQAGFPLLASVDSDTAAIQTAQTNLHNSSNGSLVHKAMVSDIRRLDPSDIIPADFKGELAVIGGPPCQAYSMAGRGKLRSLGSKREHTKDPRGNFYLDFLNFAVQAKASIIVMENVPASTNYGGQNIPEIACKSLEERGFKANWTILNAADYGVPQQRERMFLIATSEKSGISPAIPTPNNKCTGGNPTQLFKSMERAFGKSRHFAYPPENRASRPWVTVEEALSDLPVLFPNSSAHYCLVKPLEAKLYNKNAENHYQKSLRREKRSCSGHGFRRTTRDFPIFESMLPGDDYMKASEIAEAIFHDKLKASGTRKEANPERYEIIRKKTVPPYSLDKFKDKWKRLNSNKVSHTLPAHLGTDTYSHIHPWEPRGITVREAARLQSFPDNFIFPVSMGDAFKQIGNAVPPLLSEAIAQSLRTQIQIKK